MCERNLFRSYIIEFEGKGEKGEKQIKFFATLHVGTEKAVYPYYSKFIHVYYIHIEIRVYTTHIHIPTQIYALVHLYETRVLLQVL